MFELNTEQRRAVNSLEGLTVVVAGAGSGKTSVLVSHYLELLRKGLKPHEILTVTFTTDAALEMRSRITKTLRQQEADPKLIERVSHTRFIGTIHSFAYFLLNEYGSTLKLSSLENIVSEYDFQIYFEATYQNWLRSLQEETLQKLLSLYTRRELKPLLQQLYNERQVLQQSPSKSETLALLWKCSKTYLMQLETDLRSEGLYSFQDLESLGRELMENVPDVRKHLQKQFKAVLIDEFQDTSQSQWAILKPLAGENFKNLYIVGDPKQSIYSFRNADVSLFLDLKEYAEQNAGHACSLNSNYRTSDPLLSSINELSQRLFQNASFVFEPMVATQSRDSKLSVSHYEDDEKTAAVQRVKELIALGSELKDICLLFRSGDRIQDYAETLNSEKIPSTSSTLQSLFACPEILDLQSYLRAVLNPKDELALASFLHSPYIGMTWETLYSWRVPNRNSIFETLMKAPDPSLKWFVNISEKKDLPIKAYLDALFENTHYFPVDSQAFFHVLEPLLSEGKTLSAIVEAFKLWQSAGVQIKSTTLSLDPQAVKLMTIHGAKGLEFKHVLIVDTLRQSPKSLPFILSYPNFVPGIKYRKEGEFVLTPEYEALKEKRLHTDNEEANRILYVALTRAKESLDLFFPVDPKKIPKGSVAARLKQALA